MTTGHVVVNLVNVCLYYLDKKWAELGVSTDARHNSLLVPYFFKGGNSTKVPSCFLLFNEKKNN